MRAKAWCVIGVQFLFSGLVIFLLTKQINVANKRADEATSLAQQRLDAIKDMQVRQRDVAALDAKYTQELADARSKTDALRHKLNNDGRVLVKGKCPTMPKPSTAPSMDDGGAVELSATSGRNVLDIREGIQRDQSALRGLQDYIRQQCVK